MGNAYMALGYQHKAINAFKKALQIRPTLPHAYVNLGVAYGNQNDAVNSLDAYSKATYLNPLFGEAYVNLGSGLKTRKRWHEAEQAINT